MRAFLRFPIWLYRLGLGFLLGERFLHLTHTGRVSGQPRHAVIEVVSKDPERGVYYVASGWGEGSDWLRNLQKTPECQVQVGRKSFAARAERLAGAEAERWLLDYAHKHPSAMRQLAKFMGFEVDGNDEDYRKVARQLPLVSFTPLS
jgi:deazaflavin-dependent oxidoreductase (nitroreductase family)